MSIRHKMVAAVVAGGLLMSAGMPARADSDSEKLATAKEMIQAWNKLDWEKVYGLFAEDGVLQSMMIGPTTGREAIKQRLSGLASDISRIDLQVRHIGVIDGVVFVERVDDFVYRGHHGAVPVVGVMEIDQGRIKAWREYYDRAQMLEAMGVKEDFHQTN
jgi:limonene-1,2-epoxide hydrolase